MPPVQSGKALKKAGKAQKAVRTGDKRKKKKKRRKENFDSEIYKVLKQVCPDTGISRAAMSLMNRFVDCVFNRISVECNRLADDYNLSSITAREIKTAVRIIFPEEFANHILFEGAKAVANSSK